MKKHNLSPEASAAVFNALGDEIRLHLVSRLSSGEPLSITQLASGTKLTRQGVTKHLRVLSGAKLVRSRRQGRQQFWSLQPARIGEARHTLDQIGRQWETALSRLKLFVENGS